MINEMMMMMILMVQSWDGAQLGWFTAEISFIFFSFFFYVKIKSNIMIITTENGRRAARGTTRGSPLPLVSTQSGEPGDAVDRAGAALQRRIVFAATPSTSRVYDEPKKADNPRGCQLRVGSWNVGSMKGRDGELADMAGRRRLDFCCFQETKWKGKGVKLLGEKGKRYKFFWMGGVGKVGLAGVGVLVAEKWVENVVEVKRLNERLMLIRVSIGTNILNVISGYAPQVGRSIEEKEEFLLSLSKMVDEIGQEDFVMIGGDMNGHVGGKGRWV